MAFEYGGGTGQSSINEMLALARSSGIGFVVTSSYRPGDPGWHGYMNAVDLASSPAEMDRLAAYLYQYSPYLLELIHSGNPGWFVKNGQRVTAAFYGAETVNGHYDHVHLAATLDGLRAASVGDSVIPANGDASVGTSRAGCLARLATSAIVVLFASIAQIGEIVWMIR